MPTTHNNDNGSLYTASLHLEVGDKVQLSGETRARSVTYVMGSDRKGWRACFKGQGAVPVGPVTWQHVTQGQAESNGIESTGRPPKLVPASAGSQSVASLS